MILYHRRLHETTEVIEELSFASSFKSSSHSWLHLSSLFWSSDDSVLFCSSSAKQASRKHTPFLPGFYSVILVHGFGLPKIRWMPNLSQVSAWPEKEMDLWKECSVFVVLQRITPKLRETWNISSSCMINLPEHQKCTQLALGSTFILRKSVTIF